MKAKNLLLFLAVLFLFSCSKNDMNEKEIQNGNVQNVKRVALAVDYYVFSIENGFAATCAYSFTPDVAVYFSSPLLYNTNLKFKLEISKGSMWYSVPCPWVGMMVNAGETKVLLDASCILPDYIACSKSDRGFKTQKFRITLVSARYAVAPSVPFNFSPQTSNSIIAYGSKQCIDGWQQ